MVDAQLGVFGEEAVEVGEDPAPVAVPEGAAAGEPERLVAGALQLGDGVEPRPVGVGPARARCGRAARARQDLAEELIERVVDERTAIERRQLPHLLGELGDLHPEDVLHQVVERRDGPVLESGGRDDGVGTGGARHRETAQVAVEPGERGAGAGERALETSCQHGIGGTQCRRRDVGTVVPGVFEQGAQAVLLFGGGERHAGHTCRERRDLMEPFGVEVDQVVAVVTGARERLDRVEEEPRRHAVGGAAEVAPWEEEDPCVARRRERGEQTAVVVVDARCAQRQHTVGRAPIGIGEQGVVVHPGGEGALCEPAHEHAVEVEPEPERDVTHEDAVPEVADAAEVGIELELERAAEHVETGSGLDRVEPGETIERRLHFVGGVLLRLGPRRASAIVREKLAQELPRPR